MSSLRWRKFHQSSFHKTYWQASITY